jgi:hypothetical protein
MNVSRAVILLLLFRAGFSEAGSIQDWQGEWGSWKAEGGHLYGAGISIFDCKEATRSCRLRFDAEDSASRCSETMAQGIPLEVAPGDRGTAQWQDYAGEPQDCTTRLKLETTSAGRGLRAEQSGAGCARFCTHGQVTVPELYPFKSAVNYPFLSTRECFADGRRSREAWCTNAEIRAKDERLIEVGRSIDALSHTREMYEKIRGLREAMLKQCEAAADAAGCLSAAQDKSLAEAETTKAAAQKAHAQEERTLSTPGNAEQASRVIGEIEGVYKTRSANQLVDGQAYTSEDILELVRVTNDAAYFKTHLEFYNGHTCDLHGIARYTQAGIFVFKSTAEPPAEDAPSCRLQIQVTDKEIKFLDPDNSCKDGNCGMRGSFADAAFPRTARRAIRYMDRLKNSEDYKKATESIRRQP